MSTRAIFGTDVHAPEAQFGIVGRVGPSLAKRGHRRKLVEVGARRAKITSRFLQGGMLESCQSACQEGDLAVSGARGLLKHLAAASAALTDSSRRSEEHTRSERQCSGRSWDGPLPRAGNRRLPHGSHSYKRIHRAGTRNRATHESMVCYRIRLPSKLEGFGSLSPGPSSRRS